jgi:hypothetical protein
MPRVRVAIAAALCVGVLAACGAAGTPGTSGSTGTTTPGPSAGPLSKVELQLLVIDHVGADFVYCDPDSYPVAHGTELQNARQNLPAMEADPTYPVILQHLGIPADSVLTDHQLLAVYRLYKKIRFVELRRTGDGYDFTVNLESEQRTGSISDAGEIVDTGTTSSGFGCPICLARNTRIATPGGFVRVQDVRDGMTVWSTDAAGRRIRSVVLAVGHTPVPPTHRVARLVLADGRSVLVSPGHPTPGGEPVGSLRTGDAFEGTSVISAELIPYAGGFTFDLLPSGPTGTYFANGVLLGSTLARGAAHAA